jgi:DNA-binding transcriptional ArsR family regulator
VRSISEINDPRLVKALAHPLRVSILSALEHRVASPSELAEELDVPLPNLSYHIRMLVQLDLLKLVKTRPRRGAIEHYYQAKGPVAVSDKAWGQVPALVKEAMVSGSLRQIGEVVESAAAQGAFDAPETVLGRQSLKLDAKALKDLSKRARELADYAQTLQKESDKRGGDDAADVALVTMLFNTAPGNGRAGGAELDGNESSGAGRSSRSRRK